MRTIYQRSGLLGLSCLSTALVVWAAGCASKTAAQKSAPQQNGIAEYRQIAARAEQALRQALNSLAAVGAQSSRCSPEVLSAFSEEIQRLQVESIQVRAHSQAMQARGDAYFERWHENIARVKDPEIQAAAEARRPQLQESFRKIKALSQEGREAFNPFLADLRQLRNALEKDPAAIDGPATRDRIKEAMEYGEHSERCVAGVGRELDLMSAMLIPNKK